MMRAIVCDEERRLRWQPVADPVRKDHEVLIEIHAAALNRADLLQRQGKYPPPVGWPQWMGLEVAGRVLEAPEESRWQAGDQVCALLGGGGYAERVAVPENLVLPIPRGLSMVEAAALPEVMATAYLNLCVEAGMKAGDRVFIFAGASGLGTCAIQMAKALGATVITTVGSQDKEALVRQLGADVVVNHRTDDVAQVFQEHPVDIVLDCVGGPNMGKCLEHLAIGGRWILIATLGGEHADIPLRPLLKRGLRIIGSTLRSRPEAMKGRILHDLETQIWPHVERGAIRPVIHQVFPIQEAEQAHAVLERQENLGKVVLRVKE